MVQVGDFWIDRYEVSAWQNPDCSGAQYAVSSDNWPLLRDGSGSEQAFACSIEGALPAINTSWFRAVRSCAASGKSLCSNAEWQAAVASTFDPGANGEGARCHTDADATRPSGQGTGAPGSVTACVSRYGAEDMIGNVEEYVEDWFVAGRRWQSSDADNKAVPFFFSGHDDATWNLNGTSSAPTGAFVYGMPSGATRGGHYFFDVRGGVNAFILNLGPECSHYGIGTRCCISY
jgi:formylglycine-generating enzyme required for sulfatase activity